MRDEVVENRQQPLWMRRNVVERQIWQLQTEIDTRDEE